MHERGPNSNSNWMQMILVAVCWNAEKKHDPKQQKVKLDSHELKWKLGGDFLDFSSFSSEKKRTAGRSNDVCRSGPCKLAKLTHWSSLQFTVPSWRETTGKRIQIEFVSLIYTSKINRCRSVSFHLDYYLGSCKCQWWVLS